MFGSEGMRVLIYAGIDEAGYGPMLGPLCVGMAVFGVREWQPGEPAPDLWDLLAPTVARSLSEAKRTRAVTIADSKRIKLANQSKTRHPLVHLERGVLAMLASRGEGHACCTTDADLFSELGAQQPATDWFPGAPIDLPLGNDPGMLAIDAAQIGAAMARAGIELLGQHVMMIDERAYNRMLIEHRSKAGVIEHALGQQLMRVKQYVGEGDALRVVADRQGARTMYGGVLNRCFDRVEVLEESSRASRYAVDGKHGVILHSEAEDAHLPVALASMGAKLARELAMARFNRHWGAKMPELKPTAGYVQDARRWLVDAAPILSAADRDALVRRA